MRGAGGGGVAGRPGRGGGRRAPARPPPPRAEHSRQGGAAGLRCCPIALGAAFWSRMPWDGPDVSQARLRGFRFRFLRCRSDESEGWVVGAGRNSHPPQTRPCRASRSTGTRSLTAIAPTPPAPACNAVFVVSPGSRGRRVHGFQAAGPCPQHACERNCKQFAPCAEIHETAGLHEAPSWPPLLLLRSVGWQTSVPASTFRNGINMPSRRVSA